MFKVLIGLLLLTNILAQPTAYIGTVTEYVQLDGFGIPQSAIDVSCACNSICPAFIGAGGAVPITDGYGHNYYVENSFSAIAFVLPAGQTDLTFGINVEGGTLNSYSTVKIVGSVGFIVSEASLFGVATQTLSFRKGNVILGIPLQVYPASNGYKGYFRIPPVATDRTFYFYPVYASLSQYNTNHNNLLNWAIGMLPGSNTNCATDPSPPCLETCSAPVVCPTCATCPAPVVCQTCETCPAPVVCETCPAPIICPTVEPIICPTVEPIICPTVEPIICPTVEPIICPTPAPVPTCATCPEPVVCETCPAPIICPEPTTLSPVTCAPTPPPTTAAPIYCVNLFGKIICYPVSTSALVSNNGLQIFNLSIATAGNKRHSNERKSDLVVNYIYSINNGPQKTHQDKINFTPKDFFDLSKAILTNSDFAIVAISAIPLSSKQSLVFNLTLTDFDYQNRALTSAIYLNLCKLDNKQVKKNGSCIGQLIASSIAMTNPQDQTNNLISTDSSGATMIYFNLGCLFLVLLNLW